MGSRSKERLVVEDKIRKHLKKKHEINYEQLELIFIRAGMSPKSVVSVVSSWQFKKEFGVERERKGTIVVYRERIKISSDRIL